METYIALLRGINVSGKKKILMADLRTLLEAEGFENVQTYIQSGNVIFQSLEEDIQKLAFKIQEVIKKAFGFEVPVLVKTPESLQSIFNNCPFPEEKKTNSYFTLLYNAPEEQLAEEVSKVSYPNEAFVITNECVYFYCSTGYGKAKCGNNFFERKLKLTATARNYKTMVKLIEMSSVNLNDD